MKRIAVLLAALVLACSPAKDREITALRADAAAKGKELATLRSEMAALQEKAKAPDRESAAELIADVAEFKRVEWDETLTRSTPKVTGIVRRSETEADAEFVWRHEYGPAARRTPNGDVLVAIDCPSTATLRRYDDGGWRVVRITNLSGSDDLRKGDGVGVSRATFMRIMEVSGQLKPSTP